jgi:sulfite exporter TauE/SafE
MHGMPELTFAAVFLAGLAGGVHCAAMCGPIVGIVSGGRVAAPGRRGWLAQALAYNGGRIATYVLAGALTGALGAAGLSLRGGVVAQQILMAAMGLALLTIAASIAGLTRVTRVIEGAGAAVWRRVQPYSSQFLPADTPARAFGLGLVWGWLPCGMVYAALLGALATGDPLHGALLMAAFGAGTLPNLLAMSLWFRNLPRFTGGRLARVLIAAAIGAVGVVGIVRTVHSAAMPEDGAGCRIASGPAPMFERDGF